ncbi:hypothetical protein RQP46_004292 [Phenoliferia psychrophenolica]
MDSPYAFPEELLSSVQESSTAIGSLKPLVLVACGSYSPPTFLHLRMFEMARDHARANGFAVVGGFLSPVNNGYSHKKLPPAEHRVAMCELACQDSDWIGVDSWEALGPVYRPTAQVLDHFNQEINIARGGVEVVITDEQTGERRVERRQARIMLLAGSDLILTMSEPGVWKERDLHHILGLYGAYIIERSESEIDQSIFHSSSVHSRTPLALYRDNIAFVQQLVRNDVSSTKIRLFLKKGLSVMYLLPTAVIAYINQVGLYRASDLSLSRQPSLRGPSSSLTAFEDAQAVGSRSGSRSGTPVPS